MEERYINIGSVHPLSGGMAYEGQAIVNAQRLAIDEINRMGGVLGKKLRLVTGDSMSSPEGGANAALKLISQGCVAITGTYNSATAQTVAREAEKNKVPFVVTVASDSSLTTHGYRYTFRLQPTTQDFGKNFIEYLPFIKNDDMKTIAFIYEDSNYGQEIVKSILPYVEKNGLSVVGEISYSAAAPTLSQEVSRLISLDPDILVPVGYYSDQAMLIGELLERGASFDAVVGVANGAISHPSLTELYGDKLDGYYDVNYRYNPNSSMAEKMLEGYLQKYGEEMPVCAIYGYQSIYLIAEGLSRCPEADFSLLRDCIASAELTSHVLPQHVISFDGRGECIQARGVLIRIQNGRQMVVYPHEYRE